MQEQTFVIQSQSDNNLYWSNEDGWIEFGILENATIFTEDEMDNLPLPMDGQWVSVDEISTRSSHDDVEFSTVEIGEEFFDEYSGEYFVKISESTAKILTGGISDNDDENIATFEPNEIVVY